MKHIRNRKTKRSPLTNKTNFYNNNTSNFQSVKAPSRNNRIKEEKTLTEEGSIKDTRKVKKSKRTDVASKEVKFLKNPTKNHKLQECRVNLQRLGTDVINNNPANTSCDELQSKKQDNTTGPFKTIGKNFQPKVYLEQIKIDLHKNAKQNKHLEVMNNSKKQNRLPAQKSRKNTENMKLIQNFNSVQNSSVKKASVDSLKTSKKSKALKEPKVILERISIMKNFSSPSNKDIKTASKQSLNLKKRLRKQEPKNYRDSSLNNTKKLSDSTEKLPVYLKPLKKSPLKKTDVYEFNECSSSSQESDRETDKSIRELLKKLQQKKSKPKKQNNNQTRKHNNKQNQRNHVIKNALVVDSPKNIEMSKSTPIKRNEISHREISMNENVQNESAIVGIDVSMPYVCEVPSQASELLKDQSKVVPNETNEISEQNKCVSRSSQTDILNVENENSNDTVLSFASIEQNQSNVSNQNINIISDIVIHPKIQPEKGPEIQPWRPEFPMLKRNPHLLYIKKTALPCKNQEMVVDSMLVEKCATPKHTTQCDYTLNEEKLTQTSILNFVNTSKRNHEKNADVTALFDCGDLSPIKLNKTPHKVLREINSNHSPSKIKRNIMQSTFIGGSPLNKKHSPVKNKENVSPMKSSKNINNEHTYFGFEDSDGNDVLDDNFNDPFKKPMRVSFNKMKNVFKENKNKNVEHEVSNVEEQDDEVIENENLTSFEPRLFEDLEITRTEPASKSYKSRRQKRVRLPSYTSDEEDANEVNVHENVKKKKKDVRSKAEELEAEKWAKDFNALCDEISKHNLEIE